MIKLKIITIALYLVFSTQAFGACEETVEYKEMFQALIKTSREALQECKKSVSTLEYWFAYSQCLEKQNSGKINVGSNCGRTASHNPTFFDRHNIDDSYCEIFVENGKTFKRLLEQEINRTGISKCKNSELKKVN